MTEKQTSHHLKLTDQDYDNQALEKLLLLLWGFVPARAVAVAVERGVFDFFGENGDAPKSVVDLAKCMSWQVQPTSALLRLLESLQLLKSIAPDTFALTWKAMRWLRTGTPHSLAPYFERRKQLELAYEQLDTVLSSGMPIEMMRKQTTLAFGLNRAATRDFMQTMQASALEFAPTLMDLIEEHLPPSQVNHFFLDVGCGPATLSLALYKRFSSAKINAFDLSGVSEWATSYVSAASASDRIKIFASNWLDWHWGVETCSLILLSQILHEFNEKESEKLFEQAATSLRQDGLLVVVLVGDVSSCPDGDLLNRLFTLNMLVETGGMNPTRTLLDYWGKKYGLATLDVQPLPGGRSVWLCKKP
jgi:SAM-dependent methyltransferase